VKSSTKKTKRKIPETLTDKEQQKLFGVFNERYLTGQRNKTFIKTVLDSGLRISEALNLKWKHCRPADRQNEGPAGKRKARTAFYGWAKDRWTCSGAGDTDKLPI
jgi:site-specific recombinase XerD